MNEERSRVLRLDQVSKEITSLGATIGDMRIVSLDLEHGPDEGFTELGIAVWDRGRRYNRAILIDDAPDVHYLHGTPERMSAADALTALKQELVDLDALAGHDLSGDRHRLKRMGYDLPHVPVYDTARLSKHMFVPPQTAQLRAMLQIYGLSTQGLHVAGNDAAYVLDLLDAMIRQGTEPCAGPDRRYLHPRCRTDVVRERWTPNGYVLEPGGLAAPTGIEPVFPT